MKRILAMVILVLFTLPMICSADEEKKVTYEGQYMVTLSHEFAEFGEKKNSLFGSASLFGNLDGYMILYTYFGPQFKINDDLTLWFLAGTFNDTGGGMSIATSVWMDWFFGKNNIFTEGDFYIPIETHPYQFFFWGEYNRAIKDEVNLGASMELFGNAEEGELSEFALGPHICLGKWKVWPAYDWSPSLDGNKVFVRVIYEF